MSKVTIFTDGSGRGDYSYHILETGELKVDICGKMKGLDTNDSTEMEYIAIHNALLHVPDESEVTLYNDNESVVNALEKGKVKKKNKYMKDIYHIIEVKKLKVKFVWTSREVNSAGLSLG